MMKNDDGEYYYDPVHCQRKSRRTFLQDLAVWNMKTEATHVDGLGTNYHIAVPVKDFDVYSEDKRRS